MLVDSTTPEGSVRSLVLSSNTSSISRSLLIRKDDLVCDESVTISAPVSTFLIRTMKFLYKILHCSSTENI